ncbi:MAG: DUF547 domain-containing protein [Desulfobulbaceae bacterium]|nr:DUF547 domain-containing protein [Desulfobulbaceae bacterium]
MKRKKRQQFIGLTLSFALLLLTIGCTSIPPKLDGQNDYAPAPVSFDYSSYARLLEKYVDEKGRVDYRKLLENQEDLDHFYSQIATYSPDSHPYLFPDENAQLAYWINSYNSTVIKGVVLYYPIESVTDVAPPKLLFFLPSKSGFFFFQRFTYGGVEASLYYLENRVVRSRFFDPRFHFALNCASMSCPQLPRKPFYPETLDEQLNKEAAKFINSNNNVRYDETKNTLYLSLIFDWYEEYFLSWMAQKYPAQQPTLFGYILPYLQDEIAHLIEKKSEVAEN